MQFSVLQPQSEIIAGEKATQAQIDKLGEEPSATVE
jgi:hypothetical protein